MNIWNKAILPLGIIAQAACASAWANTPKTSVILEEGSGSVEFRATGRPSAIKIVGKGDKPKGRLTLDGRSIQGEAVFSLATLDTGIGLRDKHMKEKYLEVSRYPEAKLTVRRLEMPGEPAEGAKFEKVPFSGVLSLHGKDKPVEGRATLERKGDQLQISAEFGLRIADHGIEIPSFAGITMADEVQVVVQDAAPLKPQEGLRDSSSADRTHPDVHGARAHAAKGQRVR
jgi:polyisoprenoid-binding protein YceI